MKRTSKRIKVIARTTDASIFVVAANGREYLEIEARIPESAFPHTRYGYDLTADLPLSENIAFNAKLYPKNDCIRLS